MNFIEDTIFPHSSDSLRKECNIALKTSPGGSKTTFLPIKLQQSIIQAAMYAASGITYRFPSRFMPSVLHGFANATSIVAVQR